MIKDDKDFIVLSELLYQAIDSVYTGRDREILIRRFGLSDGGPQTLREVGLFVGLSRERVRQLENKIIHRLRAAWKTTIRLPAYHESAVKFKEALDSLLRPEEEGFKERIKNLINGEFVDFNPDLVKLLVAVAYNPNFRPKILNKERVQKPPKQKDRLIFKIESLLEHFNWPVNLKQDCINITAQYANPIREMGRTSLGNTGSFFSEKLQKEVIYESTLEENFFLGLERSKEVVFYREQPMSMQYQLLGETRKYVPDVFIVFKDGRGAICEVKDDQRMALHESLCKYEALRKYCEANGLGYCMTDGRYNFEHYKIQINIAEDIETAWLAALDGGDLNLDDFKKLKEKFYLSNVCFRSLILKHNLIWLRAPFRLYKSKMTQKIMVPIK